VTQAEAVARHYDALDRLYREIWGEHVHHGYWRTGRERPDEATRALVELVADAAGIGPGARVCDVGCGYGATARLLAAERGAEVVGLTISLAQHRHAAAALDGVDNPRILLRSWLENGLPDRSFDAVIAIESVSHMEDRERVLAECHRVLVPGGRLVVLDWLAGEQVAAWQRRALLAPICRDGRLPDLDTLRGYARLAASAGFVDVHAGDISARVWRTWPIVLARGARRLPADRELRRVVLDRSHAEHGFVAMTVRLLVGYATRAFRYGMVTARRA
jgi:tocopherol O-methyltransferase